MTAVVAAAIGFFVWPAAAVAELAVDTMVTAHPTAPSSTVTSPPLTTKQANELLVAFVSADGPPRGNTQSIASVTGGGLAWTLRARANAQPGTAEIWTAPATAQLSGATITAKLGNGSWYASLVVVAITGADLTTAGATATASNWRGAPSVSLRTTRDRSWVWGVGTDWSNPVPRLLGRGQVLVDQYLAPVGDTYWVQRRASVTPDAGTRVRINDIWPADDIWDLAAIEIVPAMLGEDPKPTPVPTSAPPTTPSTPTTPVPTPGPTTPPPANPDFADFAKWSNPATWGGAVPAAGANVTVPAGSKIIVDVDLPKLGNVSVLGQLAFADRPTTFRARSVMVHGGFWLGTEAQPLTSAVTIQLDGAASDNLTMGSTAMGANVLGAMGGGRIEVHGRDVGRSWTRLAETAPAGATSLTLTEAVQWPNGAEIVIASSDVDFNRKERVKVAGRSADGKTVTIDRALKYAHASVVTSQTTGGVTRSVAERAEVGLLSHNIRITGPDDAASTKFGGHVMIMGGGVLRMSNAELFAMGQIGVLGRYPIHWHFAGDGSGSLVDRVSVRDSFNRFVTVHQTDNVRVQGVVADETLGHGFFLEDGVEKGNTFADNLVMGVRPVPGGKALRKSDAIPSEFWISNPSNDLTGNSAAGGTGAGIWYDFNYNSDNTNIHQAIHLPFGRNENNTAHSHRFTGQRPFANEVEGGGIVVEGFRGMFAKRGAITNPTAWKNDGFGLWIDGAVTTTNPMAANNGVALNCQDTAINGGLLIGPATANTGSEVGFVGPLLRFYHGQCDVDGTWLAGFAARSGSSPELVGVSDSGASTWDATNRVRGLKFFGAGQKVLFGNNGSYFDTRDLDHSHWMADLDGSIAGDGKPATITNKQPMISDARAKALYVKAGSSYYAGSDFGFVGPLDRGYMRIRFSDKHTWTRDDGATGAGVNTGTVLGHTYTVKGSGAKSSLGFDIHGTDPGYVVLVFDWAGSASPTATYTVFGTKKTATKAASASALGDNQYFVGGGKLHLRIAVGGNPIPFGKGGDLSSLVNPDQYWSIR